MCFFTKHLNLSNYKTLHFISKTYLCIQVHKKNLFIQTYPVFFFTKTLHFKKIHHVFFHKTLFSQKHYISYQKHLNPSNYKTCLYNLFVYLYTKIPKTLLCFFTKTLHFKKILMCFFTKHFFHKNTTFHIKNT